MVLATPARVASSDWLRPAAAMIIPYYTETNRGFVALAGRTVEEVIADVDARRGNRHSLKKQ